MNGIPQNFMNISNPRGPGPRPTAPVRLQQIGSSAGQGGTVRLISPNQQGLPRLVQIRPADGSNTARPQFVNLRLVSPQNANSVPQKVIIQSTGGTAGSPIQLTRLSSPAGINGPLKLVSPTGQGLTRFIVQQPQLQSIPVTIQNATNTLAVRRTQYVASQSQPKPVQFQQQRKIAVRPIGPTSVAENVADTDSPSAGAGPTNIKVVKRRVMRLKCRFRPLHEQYFTNNSVSEKDLDTIFVCSDGGRVCAHKLILASCSKFFTDIFIDQIPGEISTICVPDITSDVMKLLVLMAYKDNVVVTSNQLDQLKEYTTMFGMDFSRLVQEPSSTEEVDVPHNKVVEYVKRTISPQRPINSPSQSGPGPVNRRMDNMDMLPIKRQHGLSSQEIRRLPTARRTGTGNHSNQIVMMSQNIQDSENQHTDDFTFKLQGYNSENTERRKSKLTPRVETETDDMNDMEYTGNSADSEHLINEWIQQVGKTEPDSKRPRMDQTDNNFRCTVCNAGFPKESSWQWHEERHVATGMFKCTCCDAMRPTAQSIWYHERDKHLIQTTSSPPDPPETGFEKNNQYSNIAKLNQLKRLKLTRTLQQTQKGSETVRKPNSPQTSASSIGIGQSVGSDQYEPKNVRRHWMFVCARCDNCSDNLAKAQAHYKKCYPEEDATFESTVTKFRQGFYGKSACPLCPRRYGANGGFMIHCGHMHPEYRSLFSHTGTTDDKLKCVSCFRTFSLPDEFHFHLEKGQECLQSPIEDDAMSFISQRKTPEKGKTGAATAPRRRLTPVKLDETDGKMDAHTPSKPIHPPPRSARLAKRASLAVARALENAKEVEQDEREMRQLKRRTSNVDYPPTDCPICGQDEVANISQHLTNDHKDLNISVNRISNDLLRCRKCLTTFAICDLLAHTQSCSEISNLKEKEMSADQQQVEGKTKPLKENEPEEPWEVPADLKTSSIDVVDAEDLTDIELLRKSLQCLICHRKGVKLGDVSLCLKSHGVFRCALCFNTYTDKAMYQQHMKQCHWAPGNKLKCPLCDRAFHNIGQVAGHMIAGHWADQLREIRSGIQRVGSTSKNEDELNDSQDSVDNGTGTQGSEQNEEMMELIEGTAEIESTGLKDDEQQDTEKTDVPLSPSPEDLETGEDPDPNLETESLKEIRSSSNEEITVKITEVKVNANDSNSSNIKETEVEGTDTDP